MVKINCFTTAKSQPNEGDFTHVTNIFIGFDHITMTWNNLIKMGRGF